MRGVEVEDAQGGTMTLQEAKRTVRHFRQIVLWPLQLMPLRESAQIQRH